MLPCTPTCSPNNNNSHQDADLFILLVAAAATTTTTWICVSLTTNHPLTDVSSNTIMQILREDLNPELNKSSRT
jgi:hypothetical protein